MQCGPFLDQDAAFRPRARRSSRHKSSVSWHDAEKRVRPIRDKDHGTKQPSPVTSLPPCHKAKQEADDSQRGLRGEPAFVGRLLFGEERAVV